ncbi:cell wall-binding repeat-containing protein [Euzebya rosea]|uniref:cell wall-binding repeat-containing protein n=1 Tax=Euzebya rosea TaxID=2052804 RepID=UPI0013005E8C|nr:cell wall-binding repeat-containing protein [Euzebya rosea]
MGSVVVLLGAMLAGAPPVVGQASFPADTLAIVKTEETPPNVEIAIALSQATPLPAVRTIVVGRNDEFADSLASGVLQADKPLLLVPGQGAVPDDLRAEIDRLAPERAILLGGTAAIAPEVEAELAAMGLATERRAGGSRFETAIAIAAQDAPDADTIILARAFAAPGATDPTQAFADTLAAAGMSADSGWPVLLTETDRLTAPTRDYLATSGATRVEIIGGTAAIGQAVEDELVGMGMTVERLAGPSRAATAVAIADKRGSATADDAAQVILVQGQEQTAWAGGYAAAAHSALFDAPIVLASTDSLPQETIDFLSSNGARWAQEGTGVRLTCVTVPSLCEEARLALGLPPSTGLLADPPAGSEVAAGQPIVVTIPGAQPSSLRVSGTCMGEATSSVQPLHGSRVTLSPTIGTPEGPCTFDLRWTPPGEPTREDSLGFVIAGPARIELLSTDPDGNGVGGNSPSVSADGSVVAFVSDGGILPSVPSGPVHTWAVVDGVPQLVDVAPDGTPGDAATTEFHDGPVVAGGGRHVAFVSRDGGLATSEPTASGSGPFGYVRDLDAGTTVLAAVDTRGNPVGPRGLDISHDGDVVTYEGFGWVGDVRDSFMFVHDLSTGTVAWVADADGSPVPGNNGGDTPAISADGRWVAFTHDLPLLPEDDNTGHDTYVFDTLAGTLEVVSVTPDGTTGNTTATNGEDIRGISGDGRWVAFSSHSTDLIPGEVVRENAMYLRDRQEGTTILLSRRLDGSPVTDQQSFGDPRMSDNGAWVAFRGSEDLVNHRATGCGVYRYSLTTGEMERADLGEVEPGASNCSIGLDVTDDGDVVFDEIASHHPHADPDAYAEVYRWNGS